MTTSSTSVNLCTVVSARLERISANQMGAWASASAWGPLTSRGILFCEMHEADWHVSAWLMELDFKSETKVLKGRKMRLLD